MGRCPRHTRAEGSRTEEAARIEFMITSAPTYGLITDLETDKFGTPWLVDERFQICAN